MQDYNFSAYIIKCRTENILTISLPLQTNPVPATDQRKVGISNLLLSTNF